MKTFFTADLHFGHDNIIKYCNRPWKNSKEMNVALIDNINNTVDVNDSLYFLGDFCFSKHGKYVEDFRMYMDAILCKNIFFILGNHDSPQRIYHEKIKCWEKLVEIHKNPKLVLCHYPLLEWNKKKYGAIMLHGHCHNNLLKPEGYRMMDVGVDNPLSSYKPFLLEDILEKYLPAKEN